MGKKEQEAKIKKDTVSFFGRFIPGAGSKASEVEEKKPAVQNENKPSYNKQKLSESSPLAKTTGVSKGDTSDVKKGSHQKTVIPLEGTIKRKPKKQQVEEDLPDLKAADVAKAAIQIQSAYRGFKTRKQMKESGEELPDLKAADVVAATIKIQSAYRGFKTRKQMKESGEELPDLKAADVV